MRNAPKQNLCLIIKLSGNLFIRILFMTFVASHLPKYTNKGVLAY